MSETVSNNRRIAKNALMLYVRMAIAAIVGLYTSRAVLESLGADDFGLYNVVGGVVAFLAFINGSMAGSTSRFLAFEIGSEDYDKLNKTFSTALVIHVLLCLLIFLLAETVGLWFLKTKLIIPASRFNAAITIYQLSVLTTVLSVFIVPFSATIIAHERMDVYAGLEIFNVLMKLLAVIILQQLVSENKLVIYGVLVAINGLLTSILYVVFSRLKYREVRFKFQWYPDVLKSMVSFSGFSLFSTAALAGKQQGITFIINIFFGVAVNAANAIVTSVVAIVVMLSESICNAFRPQVIKLYAKGEKSEMIAMINTAIAISMPLTIIISAIIIVNRDFILDLWLVSVPDFTSGFLALILIENTFSMFRINLNMGIVATGNIKHLSLYYGINLLCVLPLSYIALRLGVTTPYIIFGFAILSAILGVVISFIVLIIEIKNFPILPTIKELAKLVTTSFIVLLIVVGLSYANFSPFGRLIISGAAIVCTVLLMTYIQMNRQQKVVLRSMINI